jgi:nucleoside-diphosphate-sugar epimerase
MNLLITGATGFVGQNLLLHALALGTYQSIIACVRNPEKLRCQLRNENVDSANVVCIPWGAPVPEDLRIDHAVHCAGVLFARNRADYFTVNVDESMQVLRCIPSSVRLLALSSQSAGGPTPAGQTARTIHNPDAPLTWYGESKIAMERELVKFCPKAMIIRPPMILGARDQATLPLFKMAAGWIRPKPGLREKQYSWVDVGDLSRDLLSILSAPAWDTHPYRTMYAAAPDVISDRELLGAAIDLMQAPGITVPLPHGLLGLAAGLVDAIPALREATPSLTRDRVKEIFPNRWVVDASEFRTLAGKQTYRSLREAMTATFEWYRRTGQIR